MGNYVAKYTIFTGSGCPSSVQQTAKDFSAEDDKEAVRMANDKLSEILEKYHGSVRLDNVIKKVFP